MYSAWRDAFFDRSWVNKSDVKSLMEAARRDRWERSCAVGGDRFKREEDAVRGINKLCGALLSEGKVRYVVNKGSHGDFELLSEQAARALFAPIKLFVPQESGADKEVPAFQIWLQSTKRREHHSLICDPDQGQASTQYAPFNSWRGIAGKPQPGTCALWEHHLAEYTCGGDADTLRYLEAWARNLVDDPGRSPGVMPVLVGARGAGKSIIAEALRDYLGPHHTFKVDQRRHLTGNFNEHIKGKLFIVIEELGWAGDKEAEGILKDRITSPTLTVEAKNGSVTEYKMFARFMLITNEKWAVPVGVDERRFLVLTVKSPTDGCKTLIEKRAKSRQYFEALMAEIKGGAVAAWYDKLGKRDDLESVDLRRPPRTEGLKRQALHSLPASMRWMHDALERGGFEHDGLPVANAWVREAGSNAWRPAKLADGVAWPLDAELAVGETELKASFNEAVRSFGKTTTDTVIEALSEVGCTVKAERCTPVPKGSKLRVVRFATRRAWREAMNSAWGLDYDDDDKTADATHAKPDAGDAVQDPATTTSSPSRAPAVKAPTVASSAGNVVHLRTGSKRF